MTLKVYRLRRLLAATAVLLTLVVVGMYFYARHKVVNVLKEVHGKIGIDIKQTASGFQFSKSDGKRTLFTIQASDLKEFKWNGRAELHNVSIVLYGRDSSRFDQIYGDDFAFDQKTGDVTAKGEVQIDLVSNPAGLTSPDQTTPKELKNPIHLKTRDLVFNRDTGNAATDARVEFSTPQATGWAVGVKYAGKSNTLTLTSQLHVVLSGVNAAVIDAEHGVITNDPRQVVLERPHLVRSTGTMQADQATFYLGSDNNVERVLATGNVTTETRGPMAKPARSSARIEHASETHARSDQAEFFLEGKRDLIRTATLTGNVHFEQAGAQSMQGDAGRVILDFAGQNQLQKVHALDGARLVQKAAGDAGKFPVAGSASSRGEKRAGAPAPRSGADPSGPQDFDLTASAIDFTVVGGHILKHAVTSGAAQITIASGQPPAANSRNAAASNAAGANASSTKAQRTVVTAGKFDAEFAAADGRDHITSLHGAPNARIVSSTSGQPDRVSTSDSVDASFLPQGGIDAITQEGNMTYTDGQDPARRMQAWANRARYTPVDQMLALTGNPRVADGGMASTANTIRINRGTGEALAEGDVKSTYSELKEEPNGALLASSSPIHVTASRMAAHGNAGIALYTGNARLWQDANVIEAPSIQFDRDHRSVTALGTTAQPVQTILVQNEKVQLAKNQAEKVQVENPQPEKAQTDKASTGRTAKEKAPFSGQSAGKSLRPVGSSPIAITAARLTYADSERKAHYDGGVVAKGADFTATAKTLDAYLLPRSQTAVNQSLSRPGQLDRMVAEGDVVVQEPDRRALGQKLVYTAAENKFVLTGGPPSIFDAEQGKITGVSLTFFRGDGRVLVEGEASTPVVTQTRVAR
jgi:lipopolysaccharide export system protein LptA